MPSDVDYYDVVVEAILQTIPDHKKGLIGMPWVSLLHSLARALSLPVHMQMDALRIAK